MFRVSDRPRWPINCNVLKDTRQRRKDGTGPYQGEVLDLDTQNALNNHKALRGGIFVDVEVRIHISLVEFNEPRSMEVCIVSRAKEPQTR
jgi:hypothetical protein